MVEYGFTVTLKDGCLLDILSEPSTINSFVYYMKDTGLYEISTPTYIQRVENCEVEWSLVTVNEQLEELILSEK